MILGSPGRSLQNDGYTENWTMLFQACWIQPQAEKELCWILLMKPCHCSNHNTTLFLARVLPVTAPNTTKQCDFRQVGSLGCYPILGPGTLKSTNYTMGAVLEQQKMIYCAPWTNQQTQKINVSKCKNISKRLWRKPHKTTLWVTWQFKQEKNYERERAILYCAWSTHDHASCFANLVFH